MQCAPVPAAGGPRNRTRSIDDPRKQAKPTKSTALGEFFSSLLDRCRPTYAIELLETAKHLFSVDGVVFVLGINREGIEHSVSALYGERLDGVEYLRRFFDIDFRLPEVERTAFIDAKLSELQIDNHCVPVAGEISYSGRNVAGQLLQDFFRSTDLSLRTIAQALHRLGLVVASLPSNLRIEILTVIFALLLRTFDPGLYHRFARNEATDEEVADALFRRLPPDYRHTTFGRNLEAQILAAGAEQQLVQGLEWNEIDSPLLTKYRELAQDNQQTSTERDPETNHAIGMINWTRSQQRQWSPGGPWPAFRICYERLELLSTDLLDEQEISAQ